MIFILSTIIFLLSIPFRIGSLIEHVVTVTYIFIKRLTSLLYKMFIVLIFLITAFVLSFPRIVIYLINDCYDDEFYGISLPNGDFDHGAAISRCPEHLVGLTTWERYVYLVRKLCTAVDAVIRPTIEQLQWELFKFEMRQLASRLIGGITFDLISGCFRSMSLDDDFYISSLFHKIIFDSGASTNLVFDVLPNDFILGPRQLNLAAGMTSTGQVTESGEVVLPEEVVKSGKCKEELVSMGRYSSLCGKVVMEDDHCDIYTRNALGDQELLYRIPLERNCPILTPEQSQHLRVLQRSGLKGVATVRSAAESWVREAYSPSLAYMHEQDNIFDVFYSQGLFNHIEETVMGQLSPAHILAAWKISSSNQQFIQRLIYLRQLQHEEPALKPCLPKGDFDHGAAGESRARRASEHLRPNAGEKPPPVREDGSRSDAKDTEISYLSQLRSSTDPDSFEFFPVHHGANPNARKAPQAKTSSQEKLRFYRNTKGAWVIWGDIHFSSCKGFDDSEATWVYHCSRLVPKNPKKPSVDEIETVELNFPIKTNNAQTACAGLRHALECLGIWTDCSTSKKNFYFESEEEQVLGKVFEDYLLAAHGSHHTSVPYRHPAKEFAVRNLLFKIRNQLQNSSLPATAWPAIARALNELSCSHISGRPYPNKTFKQGYEVEMVGRLCYAHVPGLDKRSVDSKQEPALLLNSAPRNRVFIIHPTEKELGFRYTSVDWKQITFPREHSWVFETERIENLKIKRYMKLPFKQKLISKKPAERPRNVTCSRCVRLRRNQHAPDHEVDQVVRGHTCDQGCNYQSYNCFENLEFDVPDQHFLECPLAKMFELLSSQASLPTGDFDHEAGASVDVNFLADLGHGMLGAAMNHVGTGEERACFHRPVQDTKEDFKLHKTLERAFEDPELKSQVFNCSQLTPEECATLLFMSRDFTRRVMLEDWEKEAERCARSEPITEWEHDFYALVIKNKDVLKEAQAPDGLMKWLQANNKELNNLIERGVLKLVKMSELKAQDKNSYEIIPSLVVYSRKKDGTTKARLVACGNFQIPADKDQEGLQSGVYASTTSQIVWRSLLNIFAQSRQSIAAMDVSEAFTQTDEASQGGRGVKTFLRLPSQWKTILLPTYLKNRGIGSQNYGDFLLQVLRSIYGEAFAPKKWQQTLRRVLVAHGFKETELEEALFVRIEGGKITIISTYVDDIWVFSQDSDFLVNLMFDISRELRCTPAEFLCGAPDWFWTQVKDGDVRLPAGDFDHGAATILTERQKEIIAFFKPLKGSKRYGIATRDDPVSYVSIDLYFDGDFLVLDQSSYMEKAFQKLLDKKVISQEESLNMATLRTDMFNHLSLFEDCDKNPLLTKEQLSFLRIGVNTLSFYALSIGIGLQSALGQVARGQSAGRLRHLEALKILIFYAYQHRDNVLKVHCPSFNSGAESLDTLQIFIKGQVDASMGSSSALGTDAYARQGCIIFVGVLRDHESPVQGKSAIQSTVSLSTCEAELTASSWCAKILIGLTNLLKEIFQGATIETPSLYGDNRASNLLSSNQASLRNHRHLQLPQIWIRQQARNGLIKVFDISTNENSSDMLTKVLPHDKLTYLLSLIGYQKRLE